MPYESEMEETRFSYEGHLMFHREYIIEENHTVTDNIWWFNGTVRDKVEKSVKHVNGGYWMAVEPEKFCLRSIHFCSRVIRRK